MNTYEFLKAVLPPEGVYIIAVQSGKGFKHQGFDTLEEAADMALRCDQSGFTAYHACAAYKQKPYRSENGKYIARTQENWRCAKAFWCDIDCGATKAEEGKGYPTQTDAAVALLSWCKEKGLPYPMLINSGRGVHAYWCLTEAIAPAEWVQTASMLKTLMNRAGLLIDPSRTSDFSSVLRPVGTCNRKNPDNPLPVKLIRPQKAPIDPTEFAAKLMNLYVETGDALPPRPSWLEDTEVETFEFYQPIAVDINLCADKCPQVRQVRDTQGDANYDHWRGVIGLIKVSEAGLEVAQAWSVKRAETGHTNCDVETRYNTWNSPPPTCSFFEKCNPEGCAECPFKGKIKTPIVLGRKEPETKTEETQVVVEGDQRQEAVMVEVPELPKGYEWNGQRMVHYVVNKDGILEAHPFSPIRFYLIDRIKNAEGKFEFVARAHLPNGRLREFKIPGEKIGAGGSKLFELLGSYEVLTTNEKDAAQHMTGYIKDHVTQLMATRDIKTTHTSFGWQDDGSFLIGTRLYRADGSVTEALLNGYASDQQKCFPRPIGTVEGYAKQINWLYDRPGMEPLQYMICSMWASPLVDLADPLYNGIPVAMTGASSGRGKTTAGIAALYAFGDAKGLTVIGDSGATTKARAAILGAMRSLPVLFDEATNLEPRLLSQLCYALSNGMEPMRLQARGGQVGFANRETWRLQGAITGNTHLIGRLSLNGNSEAESMRLFEIRLDGYDIPILDPMAVSASLAEMSKNMGAAGVEFIKYVVTHRSETVHQLLETLESFDSSADLMREPKYRFFRNHMACTLTAAKIMQDLGVITFDLQRLREFAVQAVADLIDETRESTTLSPTRALERMIQDLSPQIISTPTYPIKGTKFAEPTIINGMPNGVVGRAVRATAVHKDQFDQRLFLSCRAVQDWCLKNRVDAAMLAKGLREKGILLDKSMRVTLGKGTNLTTPQTRCWMLDLKLIEGDDDASAETN